MKQIFKWLVDLRFGYKVSGGFGAILVLTAIVGAVGFFAILNLSSRFEVADQAAQVSSLMQATSLKRETFLTYASAEAAEDTRQEIKQLTAALHQLRETASGEGDAGKQLADAASAISEFSSTFDEVVSLTDQQSMRLTTLIQATDALAGQADRINETVLKTEKGIRAEVANANKDLEMANELARRVFSLQEQAFAISAHLPESKRKPLRIPAGGIPEIDGKHRLRGSGPDEPAIRRYLLRQLRPPRQRKPIP